MDILYVENLPIALPSDEIRAEVELAVARLITLTQQDQATRHELLDWLRTEFAELDADAFVEEVRKRRPKTAGRLSPAGLRDLRAGYVDLATPM